MIKISKKAVDNGGVETPPTPPQPEIKHWQEGKISRPQYIFLALENGAAEVFSFDPEPMISIESANNVIKRNVAKGGKVQGTIKERWSRDDYKITITGMLRGEKMIGCFEDCYPHAELSKLKRFMNAGESLIVYCELLEKFGINNIVIDSYSFPYTKGENLQAYEIQATSDFGYDLLIEG
jgi:hypothetical protein